MTVSLSVLSSIGLLALTLDGAAINLADNSSETGVDGIWTVEGCKIKIDGGGANFSECIDYLVDTNKPREAEFTLSDATGRKERINLPKVNDSNDIVFKGDGLLKTDISATMICFRGKKGDGKWRCIDDFKPESTELPIEIRDVRVSPEPEIVFFQPDNQVFRAKLTKEVHGTPAPKALYNCSDPSLDKRAICLFVQPDGSVSDQYIPPKFKNHVVPPNTSVKVTVVAPRGTNVNVAMRGTRGLYTPPLDGPNSVQVGPSGNDGPLVRTWSFASRTPGEADITLTANGVTTTVELVVEKSYAGAIRLGLGVVFPPGSLNRDRTYQAVQRPGSDQHEIVATDAGPAEFELVLGYAPYAFDFIGEGTGRRYVGQTLRERSAGFAPYIGLGALQANATGVELLKSIHLGIEWEPQRNFSIAFTLIARRVKRLASGYALEQAVAAGFEIPTRQTIRFAFGLVLNLSPEFFRFASSNSRNFL